jgi:chitinase
MIIRLTAGCALALCALGARADTTPFDLSAGNLSQDWSNAAQITANDDWSGVPSMVGFRGDAITGATGADPQTLLAADDPGVIDVNANQTTPNSFATGGLAEFALADPTVALTGSGTADAPYLKLYLNTLGRSNIEVSYRLRDLEDGIDNAAQQVALHYRIGNSGAWTNLADAYVADATAGPSLLGADTFVAAFLPPDAENEPEVQVRIMTTNAAGNDEWVGIDDIEVISDPLGVAIPTVSVDAVMLEEGDAGFTDFIFTFTLSEALQGKGDCEFNVTHFGGDAVVGSDFVDFDETILIPVGDTEATLTVQVIGDTDIEADETFGLDVYGEPFECDISGAKGSGTILNDDGIVDIEVAIAAASVAEGNAGTANLSLPVTLSAPASADISIPFTVTAGSAVEGIDYQTTSGNVLIATGASDGAATVLVNGDLLDELDETLTVTLGLPPQGYVITTDSALGTIQDDDAPPTIAVSSPSITEGNAGTSALTFVVSLNAPSGLDVGFTRATSNGSATAGSDYVALPAAAASIVAGQTSLEVAVQVNGDIEVEGDETLSLDLTAVTNATPGSVSGTGSILNDDVLIDVSIAAASIAEGNAGTVNLTLPVTLSAAAPAQVSIPFTVSAGTATAGVDYQTTSGNVVIAGGASAGSAVVLVNGDLLDELDETLTVTLGTAPPGYVIANGAAVGTIQDDDAPPTIAVSSPSVSEGDTGTTALTFVVSLSAASGLDVGFTRATSDGSATAGSDYSALTAAGASIAAGQTSLNVVVQVNGDFDVESDETLSLDLSAVSNATPAATSGTGTIQNDDALIDIAIAPGSVMEGDPVRGVAQTLLSLPVTLSEPAPLAVSIPFVVTQGSATGGVDYQTSAGSVLIAAGQQSGSADIVIVGDLLDEADEIFTVTLGPAPVNYQLTTASAQGTIIDNDPTPTIAVDSPSVIEGNSGTRALTFTVSLSAPSGLDVSFSRATADGTANAGTDYVALPAAQQTIVAGSTTAEVVVLVNGDFTFEPNETLSLNVTDVNNATPAAITGTGTISNDDNVPPPPALIPASDIRGLTLLVLLLGAFSALALRRRD